VQRTPRAFSEIPALATSWPAVGQSDGSSASRPQACCRRRRNAKYSRRGLTASCQSHASLARICRSRDTSQCQSHARCRRSHLDALPDADGPVYSTSGAARVCP